ncbi:sulfatase [Akkermansiaceae bacterium]|nr:sulfatase [Akkermansiaceae bacterium]
MAPRSETGLRFPGALLFAASLMMAGSAMAKNVLFFFVDDLRPELGCYGVESIKSPAIDKLASEGVLFERAYCQQAICAPSRISVMTGQYPNTTGIFDLFTPLRRTIPDAMTLPRYFREKGYVTASFGKVYHHGSDDKEYLTELPGRSLDKYADPKTLQSIKRKATEARKKGLKDAELRAATKGPDTEAADVGDEAYQDGVVARQAIESLRRNKGKPFFMCVGFAKPHLPFAAPKRYWDMYERDRFSVPDRNPPKGTPSLALTNWGELRGYQGIPAEGPLSDAKTKELRHGYAACVSFTDAQVGKVMAELDRLGLRDDTIVVLWGDHGYKLGDYGLWCKHTNLELDTRVPFIVSAPGFAKGKSSDALVEMIDVFPTLAQLTGGKIPASCEGRSIGPALKDPGGALREFAFSQYPRGGTMGYTLRTERWRYTEWIDTKSKKIAARELYDHRETQTPEGNLVDDPEHKDLVATLSEKLDSAGRAGKITIRKGK